MTGSSSSDSSTDEVDGDVMLDTTDFERNRKERSTVLVRRFYKNNQKVKVNTMEYILPLLLIYIHHMNDVFF